MNEDIPTTKLVNAQFFRKKLNIKGNVKEIISLGRKDLLSLYSPVGSTIVL
jgi:hypothetical protein